MSFPSVFCVSASSVSAFVRQRLPRLPILTWGRDYQRKTLLNDVLAALIVTIMLIPQSLAYATLAGLPPEMGLYASIVPLVVYAVLGSSRVLSVGPVAVLSLMTAVVIREQAALGVQDPRLIAITLAFLSGIMLLLMGIFRLGFLTIFLSHPVISGFISASGLLIALSQIKVLMGVQAVGHNSLALMQSLVSQLSQTHVLTSLLGLFTLVFLLGVRSFFKPFLLREGLNATLSDAIVKAGPVFAIAVTTFLSWLFQWQHQGLRIVGVVPQGLPPLSWPLFDGALWQSLCVPALLISVVGFVESVSVGQTLASKRHQRIVPDQELVALGASNVSAALTGGFPVTGGFSRSVVNFDAGAQTPAAGVFTALCIALVSLFLTPALYYLPQATLAATIIVAVLSVVDVRMFKTTWLYSKSDFLAVLATMTVTLVVGVEMGLMVGVGVSLGLFLFRTSRPHIAEVGLVPHTEHFRNVQRHAVRVSRKLVSLRVDESLYFANAHALEERVIDVLATHPALENLVLQCSAINDIDVSGLECLETIDRELRETGARLHLSEVKGPVMDRLQHTDFLHHLSGQVFFTHYQAIEALSPEVIQDNGITG